MQKPITAIILLIVLLLVWFGYPFYSAWIVPRVGLGDLPTQGQFGDLYGGLNSLFSGLALLGAVYAIVLQIVSISAQREDAMQSAGLLKQQAELQLRSAQIAGFTALFDYDLERADYWDRKLAENTAQMKGAKDATLLLKNNQDLMAKRQECVDRAQRFRDELEHSLRAADNPVS